MCRYADVPMCGWKCMFYIDNYRIIIQTTAFRQAKLSVFSNNYSFQIKKKEIIHKAYHSTIPDLVRDRHRTPTAEGIGSMGAITA